MLGARVWRSFIKICQLLPPEQERPVGALRAWNNRLFDVATMPLLGPLGWLASATRMGRAGKGWDLLVRARRQRLRCAHTPRYPLAKFQVKNPSPSSPTSCYCPPSRLPDLPLFGVELGARGGLGREQQKQGTLKKNFRPSSFTAPPINRVDVTPTRLVRLLSNTYCGGSTPSCQPHR